MTFYLWLKQKGEGCDYTIGCGETLIPLEAKTLEEAEKEFIGTEDREGWYEYYGFDDGEDSKELEKALILEVKREVTSLSDAVKDRRREAMAKAERDRKRAQLEKLKKELGES